MRPARCRSATPRSTSPSDHSTGRIIVVLVLSPIFGALVLLPYYALREVDPTRAPWSWPWRLLRSILLVELVGFVVYGAVVGDLGELWHEITHRRFSSFLVVDCILLLALLPLAATPARPPRH
jgi:hypothetical protein